MNDYTDLMLAMGAMVIYSMLLMNTNASLFRSDSMQVETELEHTAIALAQSVIDEARVREFDDAEISPGSRFLGVFHEGLGKGFDALDGHEYPVTTDHGVFDYNIEVCYVEKDDLDTCKAITSDYQKMDVIVSSDYLSNEIKLNYIKSRY